MKSAPTEIDGSQGKSRWMQRTASFPPFFPSPVPSCILPRRFNGGMDMAHVVFAWELGGGYGHVAPHIPVVDALLQRGHSVSFISRNLATASSLLGSKNVRLYQAPRAAPPANPVIRTINYAHILSNCGFDNARQLRGLIQGWHNLFELLRPDVVVFDHAPSALLATREATFKRVTLGIGFFVPPDTSPLPAFSTDDGLNPSALLEADYQALRVANTVLADLGMAPLTRLAQFLQVDGHFFRTFRELDHYCSRSGAEYLGVFPPAAGDEPIWPNTKGERVFAYLKPSSALPLVLSALQRLRYPALVVCNGINSALKQRYRCPSIHFADRLVDLAAVSRQCRFAILNGTHDTTAFLLRAGIPSLHFPITLEQQLMATRLVQQGAGISQNSLRPSDIQGAMRRLATTTSFHDAANRFAARYADVSPQHQLEYLVARIIDLATAPGTLKTASGDVPQQAAC
jgi:hypothetical protein